MPLIFRNFLYSLGCDVTLISREPANYSTDMQLSSPIFNNMIAPEWPRVLHKLAYFHFD